MFLLFLAPTFAAFCIGFLYPFVKGIFLSFCRFKTTSKWTWVGFDNYINAFQDSTFVHAFWYTALFALVSLLLINVLSFAVAYALTRANQGHEHLPYCLLHAEPHRRHRARLYLGDDL